MQSPQLGCNCISNFFNPQQKWFLTKKKEADQPEVPTHQRRNNKSADLKNESEGKAQKKSLKKRQNSNASSDAHLPSPILDQPQMDCQLRINFEPQQTPLPHQMAQNGGEEGAAWSSRQVYTPSSGKQAEYSPSPRVDSPYNDPWASPLFYGSPSHHPQQSPQRHSPQSPVPKASNAPILYSQQLPALIHSSTLTGARQGSVPFFHHHQDPRHFPSKFEQQSESWLPIREDSLIIQQFDKLFKNREQHQSHTHLNGQGNKVHIRAREAKKSKRLEKQLLVGRFAESDDDACSDPASEVIGKGFESHFQTFWEDEGYHVEETMATRSTNTKLSELHKLQSSDPDKPRFGTASHFKSYKYL